MFSYKENLRFNSSIHNPHVKITNKIVNDLKVLDIGCASGYIANELVKKGCYVVGIEIDEEMANSAKKFCNNVIIADVESLEELPYAEKFFDVIIFSDILEHLKRPDLVLLSIKKYLNADGVVIASIPNIARFEYRIKLLRGKFEYEDSGIMNRGHLRFFTLETIKKLFESSGYEIKEIDCTGLGSMLQVFKTLLSVQFIVTAKVKD